MEEGQQHFATLWSCCLGDRASEENAGNLSNFRQFENVVSQFPPLSLAVEYNEWSTKSDV